MIYFMIALILRGYHHHTLIGSQIKLEIKMSCNFFVLWFIFIVLSEERQKFLFGYPVPTYTEEFRPPCTYEGFYPHHRCGDIV